MFNRIPPALIAFGASVLLLASLIALLYWDPFASRAPQNAGSVPLVVYCAEAMRVPMEATARDYEAETGQQVELHFNASQTILIYLQITKQGDLFLPADDSYIDIARAKDVVASVMPLARMTAVVVLRPGYKGAVQTWADFVADGHSIALGDTGSTAIGKLVKLRLTQLDLWQQVEKRQPTYLVNVNDVANTVQLGSIDMGVVWDATAQQHPKLQAVHLPELDSVTAKIQIALTKFSTQPDAAMKFVRFLRGRDKGARHFKASGFSDFVEEESAGNRELVVYAGAMLRPAVEETITEFEKREAVRVTRVYNGCGILVSQMRTGDRPDLYFACDPRFMDQVEDLFEAPKVLSSNQLVIAVRKGNPLGIATLKDLGKPGLRIGVGHEQQCALGTITKETFIRVGLYADIKRNVAVVSPTGDFLVNQLRSGSRSGSPALDAVVVYRSNVVPFDSELEGIPVTGIPCAAPQQPLAVSKTTASPELSQRLKEALESAASKQRFEKLGFEWGPSKTKE